MHNKNKKDLVLVLLVMVMASVVVFSDVVGVNLQTKVDDVAPGEAKGHAQKEERSDHQIPETANEDPVESEANTIPQGNSNDKSDQNSDNEKQKDVQEVAPVNPALDTDVQEVKKDESGRYIVHFKNKSNSSARDAINKTNGKVIREHKLIPAFSVSMDPAEKEKFAKNPLVKKIEPDLVIEAVLDTSHKLILSDEAITEFGFDGAGVKVAIIDTGINSSHPSLVGKVVAEADFTGEGGTDLHGHGTHVACIVACDDVPYRGVAPGVSLMNAKALDRYGSGYMSDVIAAMEWSVDNGADVVNMSLGGWVEKCDGTDALSLAADSLFEAGVIPVVAAGNDGPGEMTLNTPGCAQNSLAVGAVDDNGVLANFSSRGPTADGRIKPEVLAPGVSITSAYGSTYKALSGTSMATPHVSAVVAMMVQAYPQKPTSEIVELLVSSTRNSVVDAYKALELSRIVPDEPVEQEPDVPEDVEDPDSPEDRPESGKNNDLADCLKQTKEDFEARRACLVENVPGKALGLREEKALQQFKDMKAEDYFLGSVATLAEKKIFKGYSDSDGKTLGEFRPGDKASLIEVAVVALRALGYELENSLNGHWADNYFSLLQKDYSDVFDFISKSPDRQATRAEAVWILLRLSDVDFESAADSPFADVDGKNAYFKWIIAAYENGVVVGDALTGKFSPDRIVNRAELATMVFRLLK